MSKKTPLWVLIIATVLAGCGGAGPTTDGGSSPASEVFSAAGNGIGPIVDVGSMPTGEASGTIVGTCFFDPNISPDQTLSLSITTVKNAHNAVNLSGQFGPASPPEIYTGHMHKWGFPEPPELQTRVAFELSHPTGTVSSYDFCFVVWTLEEYQNFAWGGQGHPIEIFYKNSGNFTVSGINEAGEDLLPASFDDSAAPGFFDNDWSIYLNLPESEGTTFVVHGITREGRLDGGEIKHFQSNPVFFTVRPGVPDPQLIPTDSAIEQPQQEAI